MDWRDEAADSGAALDDEYGKGKGHCTVCGAQWVGHAVCHCTQCHLTFTAAGGFDYHRTGPSDDRRCRTPDELTAAGYQPNDEGRWRKPAPAELWKKG